MRGSCQPYILYVCRLQTQSTCEITYYSNDWFVHSMINRKLLYIIIEGIDVKVKLIVKLYFCMCYIKNVKKWFLNDATYGNENYTQS